MFNFIKRMFGLKNTVNIPPSYFLPDEVPSNIEKIIGKKEFIYNGYKYKFCYQAIPDEGFNAFFGQGDGRNAYIRKEKNRRIIIEVRFGDDIKRRRII